MNIFKCSDETIELILLCSCVLNGINLLLGMIQLLYQTWLTLSRKENKVPTNVSESPSPQVDPPTPVVTPSPVPTPKVSPTSAFDTPSVLPTVKPLTNPPAVELTGTLLAPTSTVESVNTTPTPAVEESSEVSTSTMQPALSASVATPITVPPTSAVESVADPSVPAPPPPPPPPPMNPTATPFHKPNLPQLPNYEHQTITKTVTIDTIPAPKIANSIFGKKGIIKKLFTMQLPIKELEELFEVKAKGEIKLPQSTAPVNGGGSVSVLDTKRVQAIGIQKSSLKIHNVEDLKLAILQIDEQILPMSKLNIVKSIIPTEEEVKKLKEVHEMELSEFDKYLLALHKIPNVKSRIETWIFKLKFAADSHTLKEDIQSFNKACEELKSSSLFVELLAVVLHVCNYLNFKKPCCGFKLSTLIKLKDTKTADNKSNLLEYLIEYLQQFHPQVLQFHEELSSIPAAAKVAMSTIKETLQQFKSNTSMIKKLLIEYDMGKQASENDKYTVVMRPMVELATEDINVVEKDLHCVTTLLNEMAILFDENEMKNEPDKTFILLESFIGQFHLLSKQ